MKYLRISSLIIMLSFLLLSVANAQNKTVKKQKSPISKAMQKLLDTDNEFCKMSLTAGMKAAFINYADVEVIKMDQNKYPVFGLEDLKESMKNDKENPLHLIWVPVKAEVAKSNDLGYTFGNWQLLTKTQAGKDTCYYGNYVTIWKKQSNGKWKYVLDTGTSTPRPIEK